MRSRWRLGAILGGMGCDWLLMVGWWLRGGRRGLVGGVARVGMHEFGRCCCSRRRRSRGGFCCAARFVRGADVRVGCFALVVKPPVAPLLVLCCGARCGFVCAAVGPGRGRSGSRGWCAGRFGFEWAGEAEECGGGFSRGFAAVGGVGASDDIGEGHGGGGGGERGEHLRAQAGEDEEGIVFRAELGGFGEVEELAEVDVVALGDVDEGAGAVEEGAEDAVEEIGRGRSVSWGLRDGRLWLIVAVAPFRMHKRRTVCACHTGFRRCCCRLHWRSRGGFSSGPLVVRAVEAVEVGDGE